MPDIVSPCRPCPRKQYHDLYHQVDFEGVEKSYSLLLGFFFFHILHQLQFHIYLYTIGQPYKKIKVTLYYKKQTIKQD